MAQKMMDQSFEEAAQFTRKAKVDVLGMQNTLQYLGYLPPGYKPTGVFDEKTYEAVKKLQQTFSELHPDGMKVGGRKVTFLKDDGKYGRDTKTIADAMKKEEEKSRLAMQRREEEDSKRGALHRAVREGTLKIEPGQKGAVVLTPEAYQERLARIIDKGWQKATVSEEGWALDGTRTYEIAIPLGKGEMLNITIKADQAISANDMKSRLVDLIRENGTTREARVDSIWMASGNAERELYSYDPRQKRTDFTALRIETGEKGMETGRTYLARIGDELEKYDPKRS